MALTASEELRIRAIEQALNNIQNALNNLATKQLVKSLLYTQQNAVNTLQEEFDTLESTATNHGALIGLTDDDHTQYVLASGTRAFTGKIYLTSTITLEIGTASPEGIITANPGSLYLNSSGGENTTLYVKETGTGNIGWIAK
jgi:hypothetical protein